MKQTKSCKEGEHDDISISSYIINKKSKEKLIFGICGICKDGVLINSTDPKYKIKANKIP